MLVLSRKAGERIVIGEEVTVTVLAVRGQQIRLGIEAPADVPIRREELSWGDFKQSEKRGTPCKLY